jgi:arylsulfatase A-like enzyme/Flp pilus assembly protein TadD
MQTRPALAPQAFALLCLAACSGDEEQAAPRATAARPNVLLVTIDTLRADRLGCFGRTEAATPTIDALAGRGTRFAAAWTCVPLTLPAHATLLTGLEPPEHGLRVNTRAALGASMPTLAERARSAGWATAAFVSAAVLDGSFGLDRGFQHYDDDLGPLVVGGPPMIERPADATIDAAKRWIEERKDRAWFAWVHLYDPHRPWTAPEPFRSRHADPYDAEIAAVDEQLRRLLEACDPATTLVVVTSDHGEGLGEHGEDTHGVLVHEATLHVPLVVAGPGVAAGATIHAPVGLVDLAPTLAARAGWKSLGRGRDLADALRGMEPPAGVLYAESEYARLEFGWAPLHALRQGDDKLVEGPLVDGAAARELYDLERDPRELADRAQAERPRAEELSRVLADYASTFVAHPVARAGGDPSMSQAVAALGYAGGSGTIAYTGRDPRRSMAIVDDHARGASLLQHGRAAEALEHLSRAVASDPAAPVFRLDLGRALSATGKRAEAERELAEAVRLAPDLEQAWYHLGVAQAQEGRHDDALRSYARSLELVPSAWPTLLARAWLLLRLGRAADAADDLARVVELRPKERGVRLEQARLLRSLGRSREALQAIEAAISLDPSESGARAWLAWELATNADDSLRDGGRALDLARALSSSKPDDAATLEILAAALAEAGQPAEAARAQEEACRRAPAELGPDLLSEWRARVDSYRRGEKHREP